MSIAEYEENSANNIPEPSSLYALLAARPHAVGDLVDFAHSIPVPWIAPLINTLTASVGADSDSSRRRRKLVILGVLIERMIFEVERIPKRRSAVI